MPSFFSQGMLGERIDRAINVVSIQRIMRGPAVSFLGVGFGGAGRGEVLGGAASGEWTGCCARRVDGVLRTASVRITLSPPASVVVLLMSDFLGFYC